MTSIVRTVPDTIFGGIGKFLTLGQNPAKELPDLTDAFKVGTSLDPNVSGLLFFFFLTLSSPILFFPLLLFLQIDVPFFK